MENIRRFEVIISIANRRLDADEERKKIRREFEKRIAGSGKRFNKKGTHLVAKALGIETDVSMIGGSPGNYYDCNLCLELAREPVLTCCGHMFCWSCFHQLAFVYSNARECPVCDGEVIETEIIPIYGSASASSNCELGSKRVGLRVPPRPVANRSESFRQWLINIGESSVVRRFRRLNNPNAGLGAQVQSQSLNAETDGNNGLLTQFHLHPSNDHGTGSSSILTMLVPGAASISSPDSPSGMDVDNTVDIGSEIQTTDTNIQTETSQFNPSSSHS